MSKYVSFHNHDTMSLLDSCLKTKDLVKWAKANNMSAVGVCNHGEIGSHIKLYEECQKEGIKPLLGIEFYVTENQVDNEGKKIRDNWHLIAVAKNLQGWHNIIRLHNLSFRDERFFYDPRITLEDLQQYKEGLIITSACIGSVIGKPWLNGDIEKAIKNIEFLHNEFKDDFYLELQNHNAENPEDRKKQHNYNHFLMKLGKQMGIKCIIQNDSHYYLPEDWVGHQVLLCKNTHSYMSNPRFTFDSHEYYLKNEAEMIETFAEYPLTFIEECINNTAEIGNKVDNYNILNTKYDCPTFGDPKETYKKLVELSIQGLNKRFAPEFLSQHPEYKERLIEELKLIKQVGYIDYFLMLVDLYNFINKKGIYAGIARGSCGGSLVLYCLGVTHIDPIKYGLLLSRFISPARVSMADVDLDSQSDRRQELVDYLRERYGIDHVCNIGTYGELTAKSAFKATASVLEVPFDIANKTTGLMDPNLTLEDNYKEIPEFKKAIDTDELLEKTYKLSLKIEGTYVQKGIHACGNMITTQPLDEVCACATVKDPKTNKRIVCTSFPMKEIDSALKLLKLDLLGLKNLTIIHDADQLIQQRHGYHPDYKNLDLHDEKTYKMLSDGESSMVFQFESPLMVRFLKQVQPRCIEDLSCITSIARPGALESGLADQYVKRRQGLEPVTPFVEGAEKYMEDSLQLPIYQENIMALSQHMAGFTGAEADTLRKYIGKKNPEALKKERSHFVEGCIKNGYTEEVAQNTFDMFEKFGGYGFNKSHAVGYSVMSYITAYYKANYPVEYITATLNSVPDDLDKINIYINEAYKLGIPVLPPDINESGNNFTINNKGEIRFGFNAIKGLGKTAINDILKARETSLFTSVTDLIKRTTKVDRSNIQTLLKVGAFNSLEPNPKRWVNILEYLTDAKNSKQYTNTGDLVQSIYTIVGTKQGKKSAKYIELQNKKRELKTSKADKIKKEEYTKQQNKLIELYIEEVEKAFTQYTKYEPKERIQFEQELLGFNISTNPYKRWNQLKKFFIGTDPNVKPQYVDFNKLMSNPQDYNNNERLHTVAILSGTKEIKTKRGKKMAWLTVEYFGVKSDITVFPDQWESIKDKLQKGNMVAMTGRTVEVDPKWNDGKTLGFKLETIRQLDVLVSENIKCIIDMTGRNRKDVDMVVKQFAVQERGNNEPISKVVLYKFGDKVLILNGLCWVNNPRKLVEKLG